MKNSNFTKQLLNYVFVMTLFALLLGCNANQLVSVDAKLKDGSNEREWPRNKNPVTFVDDVSADPGENTSGITYQPKSIEGTGYLWVVKNGPSMLYRLAFDSSTKLWIPSREWELTVPSGAKPDPEGVTKAEWDSSTIYIASEREGKTPSKLAIVAYDTATLSSSLSPSNEWVLTHDSNNSDSVEKSVNPNEGLEGLTWIPDSDLEASKFYDQRSAKTYNSADYPDHGTGLFVAGLEDNGKIYIYALNHSDGSFKKIASLDSGFSGLMGLEYDRSTKYLWIHCDNNCGNSSKILEVESDSSSANFGHFTITVEWDRPTNLDDSNYEGIALFPDEECTGSGKSFIWANDDGKKGKSLSSNLIPCGRFVGQEKE